VDLLGYLTEKVIIGCPIDEADEADEADEEGEPRVKSKSQS
jgi:hypothetical protein